MPLLRKQAFRRLPPPKGIRPEEEIFYCEATKEVFRDYEDFFQRTILCNSLVWSCSITGKANLTYDEAIESEKKARKRLGTLPRHLKRGLLWLANKTRRGRMHDLVDDVFRYAYNRYFKGELVEAVIGDMWCECKVLKVIPPTQEEIDKDKEEEREAEEKEKKEREENEKESKEKATTEESKSPKKGKEKKAFLPHDYLFKYEVLETMPDDPDNNPVVTVEADDVRREKGCYTREKNLLFLKNVVELGRDGNFRLKKDVAERHKINDFSFHDIFAGPPPEFEETKRIKGLPGLHQTAKKKVDEKKGGHHKRSKSDSGKPSSGKSQGTLDGWVKGDKKVEAGANKAGKAKVKKQTQAEIEAEMERMKENRARFKEEMRQRAEEAKKKKIEEKAKEKERKKEEKRLLNEVMCEWKRKRDDLECDDLRELPKPKPVHCRVPNQLFGDFLTLLEFFHHFSELLQVKDSFPGGVTFDILEDALTDTESVGGSMKDVLSFLLDTVFDLQDEEDEDLKIDRIEPVNEAYINKNFDGEDMARQIKAATEVLKWPMKTQGVRKLRELHIDQWSITEILRLHLEAGGAFRSDKLIMWLWQQRGGYRLTDDPGLHFRMEEPQVLEALSSKTVYELSISDKIKILTCLMYQILSFASIRDDIEERFIELTEAKSDLRAHQIAENRRLRDEDEARRAKKREERLQKKEEDVAKKDDQEPEKKEKEGNNEAEEAKEEKKKKKPKEEPFPEAHLTERQRLAIQSQKEKEEKERQRKEEIKKSEALGKEQNLAEKVAELQSKAALTFLGRDRAYRRFWVIESLPGIYVEHDDDNVGPCLPEPTPFNESSGPLDEQAAMEKVRAIMNQRLTKSPDEKASSDKENDQEERKNLQEVSKTYSKKQPAVLKQKVLSTKNGTLDCTTSPSVTTTPTVSTSAAPPITPNNVAPEAVKTEIKEEIKEEVKEEVVDLTNDISEVKKELPWGLCLADTENCPVHSTILPKTHWSYYSTIEDLDTLIESLNPRGIRECDLREKLEAERDKHARNLRKFDIEDKLTQPDAKVALAMGNEVDDEKDVKNSVSSIIDLALRDQILELEEKIYLGTLGTLKIQSRELWQKAIQEGTYDKQCETLSWGGKSVHDTPFVSRLQSATASREGSPDRGGENKRDSGGSSASATAARQESKKIRDLASAILQISQMVEEKYIKPPLGEDEKLKKKRLKEEERRQKVTKYLYIHFELSPHLRIYRKERPKKKPELPTRALP